MMEKVQKIDHSYTAPSSKTFRDEENSCMKELQVSFASAVDITHITYWEHTDYRCV
jgi:hypothetical protein